MKVACPECKRWIEHSLLSINCEVEEDAPFIYVGIFLKCPECGYEDFIPGACSSEFISEPYDNNGE